MWQREHNMKILTVETPVDHTFAPFLTSFVSARWTVAVSAVIETDQSPIAALAVVKMASHVASATRGKSIHNRANVRLPLVAITLLIELRVPTIPPQDVIDFESVGFGLR